MSYDFPRPRNTKSKILCRLLFVRFFIRSYLGRTETASRPAQGHLVTKSSYDAVKGVEREIFKAMSRDRGSAYNSTSNSDTDTISIKVTPALKEQLKDAKTKLSEEAKWLNTKVSDDAGKGAEAARDAATDILKKSKNVVDSVSTMNFEEVKAKAEETASSMKERIKEATTRSKDTVITTNDRVIDATSDSETKAEEKVDSSEPASATTRSMSPTKTDAKRSESPSKNSTSRSRSPTKRASKIPTKAKEKADSTKTSKSTDRSKDASTGILSKVDAKVKATMNKYQSRSKTPDRSGETSKSTTEDSKVDGLLNSADAKAESLVQEAYAAADQAMKTGKDDGDSLSSKSTKEERASSYEVSIDEITTSEEKEAEREMQPQAGTDGAMDDEEDGEVKEDEEEGDRGESSDLAASYEANFDEVMNRAQKEAEKEFLPGGASE